VGRGDTAANPGKRDPAMINRITEILDEIVRGLWSGIDWLVNG
jgi:hypothetical protein